MEIKDNLKEILAIARKEGILHAFRQGKIKYSRHIGHKEIGKMAWLETFLMPVIEKYQGRKTALSSIPENEKNLFVCWWAGFKKAPRVVSFCFENLQNLYGEKYNILPVDKENYQDYTHLDPLVLERFEQRRISMQTLTDILRVKLLLDRGGYWIDSTILLDKDYPFFERLQDSSFDSFYATTPLEKNLIEYKGKIDPCLSFFLGGRKGSLVYSFVYDAFLKYLRERRELPPYFLLDMILTLAMVYDIDVGAVNKIVHHDHDIYFVQRNEKRPASEIDIRDMKYPQKLNWRSKGEKGTFLDALLSKDYWK